MSGIGKLEQEDTNDKIPLDQVLDDIYDTEGGIKLLAARDYYYYYLNYATKEEQIKMDREDKIIETSSIIFAILMAILFIIVMIISL